jgi:hypothetical protein
MRSAQCIPRLPVDLMTRAPLARIFHGSTWDANYDAICMKNPGPTNRADQQVGKLIILTQECWV